MFGLHETIHNTYGICLWTLLAFLVLIVMIIIAAVHIVKQKNRDDRNEKKRERYAEEMEAANNPAASERQVRYASSDIIRILRMGPARSYHTDSSNCYIHHQRQKA